MKTEQQYHPIAFPQTIPVAVRQLKRQLQHDYEQAYPGLREVIHLVLDEEESKAWDLTAFPHLLLPDLVEAHIATLNLLPVETKHASIFTRGHSDEIDFRQPAYALCG